MEDTANLKRLRQLLDAYVRMSTVTDGAEELTRDEEDAARLRLGSQAISVVEALLFTPLYREIQAARTDAHPERRKDSQ